MKYISSKKFDARGVTRTLLSVVAIFLVAMFLLSGCAKKEEPDVTQDMNGYTHLSPEDAATFIDNAEDEGALVMDVRGKLQYDHGHIPGAIMTDSEDYKNGRVPELPDLDQKILVYCDFGGLSKEVAEELVDQGYTNVYEFKGMDVWTGEVVVEPDAE